MGYQTDSIEKHRNILEGYIPIFVRSLKLESVLDFNLYLYNGEDMILYRDSQLAFTSDTREKLFKTNITRLYISREDRRQYQKYVRSCLREVLADKSIDEFTRASIVYDSAKELIKDVFADPTKAENIKDSQEIVETTVQFVLEGKNTFHNMLKVMSFDYTLYSHSVNVCTFSLALAHSAGIDKTFELIELGTGALLHDIGKVKIPDTILHKAGPLNDKEWKTIRTHPQLGVDIVSITDMIPEASYLPIKQHHERRDKSGYPDCLGDKEIHIYSKIVAIADVFDAMTTERVYRPAQESYSALKAIFEEREGFDQNLLEHFTWLLGPK